MARMDALELENPTAAGQRLAEIQDTLCSITIDAASKSERNAARIGWLMWVLLAAAVVFSILVVALLIGGKDLTEAVTPAIGTLVTGTVWVALNSAKKDEEKHAIALRKEAKGYCAP